MGGESAPLDVPTSVKGLADQVEGHAGRGGQFYLDYQGTTIDW